MGDRYSRDDRGAGRCPVCGGQLVVNAKGVDRCRTSLCAYNHRDVKCPRCGMQNIKSVWSAAGESFYSCASCQAKWSEKI